MPFLKKRTTTERGCSVKKEMAGRVIPAIVKKRSICLAVLFCLTAAGMLAGCAKEEEAVLFSFAETGGAADDSLEVAAAELQGYTAQDAAGAGQAADEAPEGSVGEKAAQKEADPGMAAGQPVSGTEEAKAQPDCVIHICGAVNKPGVYTLPADSRIMDAVTAAGGFLPEAAQDARNLAELIEDGCRIWIPTAEEVLAEKAALTAGNGAQAAGTAALSQFGDSAIASRKAESVRETAEDTLVNLNTADAAMLQTLPGIGESRAAAILAYRNENGPFLSREDIMKVSGIKQAAFDKLKDRITV